MDENQMSEELFSSEPDDLQKSSSPQLTGDEKDSPVVDDDDLTQYDEDDVESEEQPMETEPNSEEIQNSEEQTENNDVNSESELVGVENESEIVTEASEELDDEPAVENSEEMAIEDSENNSEIPVENSEEFENTENLESENFNDEEENTEETHVGDNDENENDEEGEENAPVKLSQFPMSKIRRMMRICLDKDEVKIVSKDSAFLVGIATELFVAALAQETAKITHSKKKKVMTMEHLVATISDSEIFSFLEGTMVPDYNF